MFTALREKIEKIRNVNVEGAFMVAITEPDMQDVLVQDNITRVRSIKVGTDEVEFGVYADSQLNIERGKTPGDQINLDYTGAFLGSIHTEVIENEGVVLVGDTEKFDNDSRFDKAVGLSETDRVGILPKIRDLMLENIKEQL